MGGWDATGIRRHLGYSYSEENRDYNVLGQTTPDDPEETPETYVISVTPQVRTVTTERAEWIAITQAGAEAKTATAGFTITAREPLGNSGEWRVTEEKVTKGAWTDVVEA